MLKILLLSTTLLFANEFTVNLSCDKIPEYMQACDTNVTIIEEVVQEPIYTFTNNILWGYGDDNGSAFVGPVEIRYVEGNVETLRTNTDMNGTFTAEIIPDESFQLYAYDTIANSWLTHENKYILRIGTTTGNLLWKEWKPSTSRWISLDLEGNVHLTPVEITRLIYDMKIIEVK